MVFPVAPTTGRPSLMTFNLRRHTWLDRRNAWPNRRDAVAAVIRHHAPDLVATQEATLPMLRDLDERLPGYQRVGGVREHWPGEEPNAIYYDPERLRVVDAGVFWLSRRPLDIGSRTWGEWTRRSALWARIVFRATGAAALVVNTHFDHVSGMSRRRSAQLLRQVAPDAILLGDFNARPHGIVHALLMEDRWDPLRGARHTHNVFTLRDRGRIDWILLPDGLRASYADVLAPRRPDGGPVSDHHPVVVDIEVPTTDSPAPRDGWTWPREMDVPTRLPPAADARARRSFSPNREPRPRERDAPRPPAPRRSPLRSR